MTDLAYLRGLLYDVHEGTRTPEEAMTALLDADGGIEALRALVTPLP